MHSVSKTSHPAPVELPRHFYSLDALRGLAALSVVLAHWQHFLEREGVPLSAYVEKFPFYAVLRVFYTDGGHAVDLFFCLSGFIFTWLYAERISDRRISLRNFFVLRFSRLYPLHFVTLLFVAAGQWWMLASYGSYFVYQGNDLYHFGLQLIFASSWGIEHDVSFNGPIWSVSVEIFLYAVFFAVSLLRWNRWWHFLLWVGVSYFLMVRGHSPIGRGLFSFFIGGLAYYSFGYLAHRRLPRISLICLSCGVGLLWMLLWGNLENGLLAKAYNTPGIVHKLTYYSRELFLYPLTILALALWEARRGTLGRRISWLGDISYSSYLLHFPLQLLFFGLAMAITGTNSFFNTPASLVAYFVALIGLSLGSYHYLERPCQSRIRNLLLK